MKIFSLKTFLSMIFDFFLTSTQIQLPSYQIVKFNFNFARLTMAIASRMSIILNFFYSLSFSLTSKSSHNILLHNAHFALMLCVFVQFFGISLLLLAVWFGFEHCCNDEKEERDGEKIAINIYWNEYKCNLSSTYGRQSSS